MYVTRCRSVVRDLYPLDDEDDSDDDHDPCDDDDGAGKIRGADIGAGD